MSDFAQSTSTAATPAGRKVSLWQGTTKVAETQGGPTHVVAMVMPLEVLKEGKLRLNLSAG